MVSRRRAAGDKGRRRPAAAKKASQEETVMLTLSPGQVEQVLRASTTEETGLTGMLGADQLSEVRERRYRALLDDRRLSRSLLAGLLVLTCFPPGGGELGIADLARRLDMRTSTIHRYVSTLLAAGLLERDPVSRQYRLAQQ